MPAPDPDPAYDAQALEEIDLTADLIIAANAANAANDDQARLAAGEVDRVLLGERPHSAA